MTISDKLLRIRAEKSMVTKQMHLKQSALCMVLQFIVAGRPLLRMSQLIALVIV